jgi:hypothetical protein
MICGTHPSGKKLYTGKLPHIPDSRDLKLAKYIDRGVLIDVAMAPLGVDWTAVPLPDGSMPKPDRDPLYNNKADCCVDSMFAHWINATARHVGLDLVVTADMVRDLYISQTGYDPLTGRNDTGLYVREVLKALMKGFWGVKLLAFATVDWTNEEEVALANWLGVGTLGGYSLPASIWTQTDETGLYSWRVPAGGFPPGWGPGSAGGHAIYQHGQRNGNTWGESVIETQPWIDLCCNELYLGVLDISRLATGRIPAGFAWNDFLADVQARQAAR